MKYIRIREMNYFLQTTQEELANIMIHAFGVVLGCIGVPVLISIALQHDKTNDIISTCVYGFGFLMTFTFSTLYHSCCKEKTKHILLIMDHISIYFLIAGTYTPFVLNYMHNEGGLFLLIIVWLCTLAGIFFKIFFKDKYIIASVAFYLFMGLLFLLKCQLFFASMPYIVGLLIVIGVLLYIIGVVFFLWRKWRYHHAIWHAFVLLAGLCHFTAVALTIAP
jgi:hemolysin III